MLNRLDDVIRSDDFYMWEDYVFQHIVMTIFSYYEFCIGLRLETH